MPQYGIQAMGMLSVHNHSNLTQGGAVPVGSLAGHNDIIHNALGIELLGDKVFINETVNTKMVKGLTIQQDGEDGEILALKSSDVAVGCTDRTETDTYGFARKRVGDVGGLSLWGLTEDVIGLNLVGVATGDNTNKNGTATAPINLDALKKLGTNVGAVGADGNLVVMRNNWVAKWLLDEHGNTWQPGIISCASLARLCLGASTELTINGAGAITVTRSYHTVDGQGDLDDNLDTINGGVDGQILVLKAEALLRDITVRDSAGNIELEGGVNFVLDTYRKKLYLFYDALVAGGRWCEINRFSG